MLCGGEGVMVLKIDVVGVGRVIKQGASNNKAFYMTKPQPVVIKRKLWKFDTLDI